jgi:tetratricopeptide (TPR) repeat protein
MYRGALGLDRNNARAKAGISAIPDKAKAMFESQIAGGKLNKAYAYIDAIQAVAPSDGSTGNMRIKLAQAYVKLADQQIGQSQYDAAGRSLAKARELAPDDPSIGALDEKLKTARAGLRRRLATYRATEWGAGR